MLGESFSKDQKESKLQQMNEIELLITTLENTPSLIIPLVREAPPAILKRRPALGVWSAHEHACHLPGVHPLFFSRLDLMLRETNPVIKPYFPHVDDEDGALLKVDLDEALERFVKERQQLTERLRQLSPQDWARTAEHGEYSHYSVFIMFRHLALHDMMHAYHIEDLLLKKDWT
jgi:hypothetical protein